MKKRSICIWQVMLWGAGFAVLQGCAANSTQGGDNHLKELEKQITQLKAENANLQARTRVLDDKVLLYEKKQTLTNRRHTEGALRTVRLSASTVSAPEEELEEESEDAVVDESSVSFRETFSDDEKRPVLKLNESSFAQYDSVPVPNRSVPTAPKSLAEIPSTNRGDNLGVVSAEGQIQQAEADSMELFNVAYRSYNNRDYGAALAGFSEFLQKESNHKYADNAMFWIAECYLAQGKLFKAVGEFERLLHRYPGSEQASSSLYRIGFVYDRMEDSGRAMEYYFKVVEQYPGSEAARKASKRIADNNGNSRLVRTSAKR